MAVSAGGGIKTYVTRNIKIRTYVTMKKESIIYALNSTTVQVEDNPAVTSYGITCLCGNVELERITDISPDKSKVEQMINKYNRYDLDPKHLLDLIEEEL